MSWSWRHTARVLRPWRNWLHPCWKRRVSWCPCSQVLWTRPAVLWFLPASISQSGYPPAPFPHNSPFILDSESELAGCYPKPRSTGQYVDFLWWADQNEWKKCFDVPSLWAIWPTTDTEHRAGAQASHADLPRLMP